jgi:hypothetical protein
MREHRFSPSLPRKIYWSRDVGGCARCPDCHAALECEQHAYVMATRGAGELDIQVVGNKAGHFCSTCPTVVLDSDEFMRFARLATGRSAGVEFTVIGLVDLAAVPEGKRGSPLGGDANPIPLVEFTNVAGPSAGPTTRPRRPGGK